MEIQNSQKQLKSGDNLALLDWDTLKYCKHPIARALYKTNVGRPRKDDNEKAKATDRIKCNICGKMIIRSGRTKHNQSKYHQTYVSIEKKLRKALIDD